MAANLRSHSDEEEYDDDDKKVYKTKKVLFVDSHGVKNFPISKASNTYLVAAQSGTMTYLE